MVCEPRENQEFTARRRQQNLRGAIQTTGRQSLAIGRPSKAANLLLMDTRAHHNLPGVQVSHLDEAIHVAADNEPAIRAPAHGFHERIALVAVAKLGHLLTLVGIQHVQMRRPQYRTAVTRFADSSN